MIRSRRPIRIRPSVFSDCPWVCTLAVSEKLVPASRHASTTVDAAASSAWPPKVIVPMHSRETLKSMPFSVIRNAPCPDYHSPHCSPHLWSIRHA